MKIRILIIVVINFLYLMCAFKPVFALEHTQMDGVFSMNIPATWHWVEYQEGVLLTYPDGKTVAINIQMVPSRKLSADEIKKDLKEADDKLVKEGVEAHHGTLIDDKEISMDGVYATRLDFKTAPPNSTYVTDISFFNKGYAFTITYGSEDQKIESMMDDVTATFKFR